MTTVTQEFDNDDYGIRSVQLNYFDPIILEELKAKWINADFHAYIWLADGTCYQLRAAGGQLDGKIFKTFEEKLEYLRKTCCNGVSLLHLKPEWSQDETLFPYVYGPRETLAEFLYFGC